MQKQQTVRVLGLALLAAASVSACGGNDNIVRPEGFNATDALAAKRACTVETLKQQQRPYTIEWGDQDRSALEAEMDSGIALVKFTCDGIQVLSGCAIRGASYSYSGQETKTKVLQMNDATEAQTRLNSYTVPGSFQAAFAQGKGLNLAYVSPGVKTTTVQSFNKEQIPVDRCKDATHFVHTAQLGAFTLATGERGKAAAAGEVLGYGEASGQTSSSKEVQSSDGDPQSCGKASKGDKSSTPGCSAMISVSLIPLSEGKPGEGAPVAAEFSCTDGAVAVDGVCIAEKDVAEDETFLCKPGNWQECQTQCSKGSDESCGRLAGMIFGKHLASYAYTYNLEDTSYKAGPEDNSGLSKKESGVLKEGAPYLDRMKASCQNVEPDACLLAAAVISIQNDGDDYPQKGTTLREFAPLMEQGCRDGQSLACQVVGALYGEETSWASKTDLYGANAIKQNVKKFEEITSEGCDSGGTKACDQLAEFFYGTFNFDDNFQPDHRKAAKYWGEACLGGLSSACMYSTAAYLTTDPAECQTFLQNNLVSEELELCLGLPCEPNEASEIASFCKNTAGFENKAKAYYASSKACYIKDGPPENANLCLYSAKLKQFAADDE